MYLNRDGIQVIGTASSEEAAGTQVQVSKKTLIDSHYPGKSYYSVKREHVMIGESPEKRKDGESSKGGGESTEDKSKEKEANKAKAAENAEALGGKQQKKGSSNNKSDSVVEKTQAPPRSLVLSSSEPYAGEARHCLLDTESAG